MTVLIISKFDVDDLSAPAVEFMKAAVRHAANNRPVKHHSMSIEAFCSLAGLAILTIDEFAMLLKLACKALVLVEAIDTEAPGRDDLPYSSWPIFNEVWIDDGCFTFEVSHRTFDNDLLSTLQQLKAPERRKNRKVLLVGNRKQRGVSTVDYWKPIVVN